MRLTAGPLGTVLRQGSFRNFWIGFTLSGIGDAMTKTALVWYVFQTTGSPVAVGLLLLAYAGPVTVGGLVAGYLLDRFDRRRVMLIDSVVRGIAVASVPAVFTLGHLFLWQVYVVASVYGFLFMIGLAGVPSVIPSLVDAESLNAANSLETLGFTISGVAGPAVAGFLIASVGAPYVLALDAVSYGIFAAAPFTMRLQPQQEGRAARAGGAAPYRMADAARLLLGNSVLLATTLMFMSFNAGAGFLSVWLPIDAAIIAPNHGAELYGILLTVIGVGETSGALVAGAIELRLSAGRLICFAQVLAGLGLALALVGRSAVWTAPAVFLVGFFSAPMTAWAQTLRMRVIPAELRGRSFALLRTLMQASAPAFSAIGGGLMPLVGLPVMIALSVALIAVPGLAGNRVRELVTAA